MLHPRRLRRRRQHLPGHDPHLLDGRMRGRRGDDAVRHRGRGMLLGDGPRLLHRAGPRVRLHRRRRTLPDAVVRRTGRALLHRPGVRCRRLLRRRHLRRERGHVPGRVRRRRRRRHLRRRRVRQRVLRQHRRRLLRHRPGVHRVVLDLQQRHVHPLRRSGPAVLRHRVRDAVRARPLDGRRRHRMPLPRALSGTSERPCTPGLSPHDGEGPGLVWGRLRPGAGRGTAPR